VYRIEVSALKTLVEGFGKRTAKEDSGGAKRDHPADG